jgi:hypothetical protein
MRGRGGVDTAVNTLVTAGDWQERWVDILVGMMGDGAAERMFALAGLEMLFQPVHWPHPPPVAREHRMKAVHALQRWRDDSREWSRARSAVRRQAPFRRALRTLGLDF